MIKQGGRLAVHFLQDDGKWKTQHLPRYPDVHVDLVGEDGNAHNILGLVRRALREAGVPKAEVAEYFKAAQSGDYDHLLRVTMAWVDVR